MSQIFLIPAVVFALAAVVVIVVGLVRRKPDPEPVEDTKAQQRFLERELELRQRIQANQQAIDALKPGPPPARMDLEGFIQHQLAVLRKFEEGHIERQEVRLKGQPGLKHEPHRIPHGAYEVDQIREHMRIVLNKAFPTLKHYPELVAETESMMKKAVLG